MCHSQAFGSLQERRIDSSGSEGTMQSVAKTYEQDLHRL